MGRRCLLFAYGMLQPGYAPPRSLVRSWPDRVRGVLIDLGEYPAALQLDDPSQDWIEGHLLEIDADELPTLDEFEDTESGEFCRRLVTTEQGFVAWIYEYKRPRPEGLKPRARWRS